MLLIVLKMFKNAKYQGQLGFIRFKYYVCEDYICQYDRWVSSEMVGDVLRHYSKLSD
jgi:hypothetical protein